MPHQLAPTSPGLEALSLRGEGELSELLRGALKANLIHHLAHTGDEEVMRRIGRAYRPSCDWTDGAPAAPRGAALAVFLEGARGAFARSTRELRADDPALALLERASAMDGAWPRVALALNLLRLWEGEAHFARALRLMEEAVSLAPGWAWAYLLRGEAKRSLLDYPGSLADYDAALSLDPHLSWAPAFSARVRFQERAREEDIVLMDRALALEGAGWMRAWKAESLRRLGRFEEAEAEFAEALRLDPLYDQGYCWRAKLLEARGRAPEAEESLRRGLELCPDFEKAYRPLIRVLRRQGRTGEALEALRRATELNHRNSWLGNWRVEGWPANAETESTLGELSRHAAAGPGAARPRAWLGETLGQLGRDAEALRELDAALALAPDLAWALAWKGESLLRLGRPQEALSALDAAVAKDPGYARALVWRGRARADLGDSAAAVRDYDAALSAKRVEYAWISAWRGEAKLRLGRREEALADLEAARRLDSNNGFFSALLAEARGAAPETAIPWDELMRCERLRLTGRPAKALARLARLPASARRAAPWSALLVYRLKRELGRPGASRALDAAFRSAPASGWLFGLEAPPAELGARAFELARLVGLGASASPALPGILAYHGQALLARGDRARGLALLERAAASEPSGWILAWLGEAQRQAGKLDEALATFARAAAADPRYDNARAWRASALLQKGRASDALADLEAALALRRTPRALLERSRALRALGRVEESLDSLEEAARANWDLGWNGPGNKGLDAALQELRQLCRRLPKQARLRAWLGETLLRAGKPNEALRELDAALKRSPELAWARAWRVLAALSAGRPPRRCSADARLALAGASRWPAAHVAAAELALRLGRPDESARRLARAAALSPHSARLRLMRARALAAAGLTGSARAQARGALALHPGFDEARLLAQALERGEDVRPTTLLAPSAEEGPSFELFVNYACNAKCPFCFNPPDASPELERGLPLPELARRLYAARAHGFRALKLIGGEATVRDDLPQLIALARRLGFSSVQLTTNGLRLAEPAYAARLAGVGLDRVRFSIHGHASELHDGLLGVPGALAKVERAVAQARRAGLALGINYVLSAVNVEAAPETLAYFHERLGIDDVVVYFLRYQGYGALPENKERLKLTFSRAVPALRRGFRRLRRLGAKRLPTLIHFAPCVAPDLAGRMLDWTRDPEGSGERNDARDRVTLPDGSGGLIHDVTNSGKRPVAACARCALSARCLGVETQYVAEFGEAEFSPILRPRP